MQVADIIDALADNVSATAKSLAKERLLAAIPESEWEPTVDMVEKYMRTRTGTKYAIAHLKAMHREGLIP